MDPTTIYEIDLTGTECANEDNENEPIQQFTCSYKTSVKVSPSKSCPSMPLTPPLEEDESVTNSPKSQEKVQSGSLEGTPSLSPSTIDAILNQLQLGQPIDLNLIKNVGGCGGFDEDEEDNALERSVSSEIASIQKLIEGIDLITSFSASSQVAGGNTLHSHSTENLVEEEEFEKEDVQVPTLKRERTIDDVLNEYEDLERSLSQASGVGIDDSFRSEIAPVPVFEKSASSNNVSGPTQPPPNTSSRSLIVGPVPLIKPPVLKSIVREFPPPPPSCPLIKEHSQTEADTVQSQLKMFAPPPPTKSKKSPYKSQVRPKPTNSSTSHPKSSRAEGSCSAHEIKCLSQSQTNTARETTSSTATIVSGRNNTQDAFKPRNRRMTSPRTAPHRNPSPAFSVVDLPRTSLVGGGGEGCHLNHPTKQATVVDNNTNEVIATEALKTIEKLNALVTRQETMLEAVSRDNETLWNQLKQSKCESSEKEAELQDTVNSLKAKHNKEVDGLSKQVRTLQKILFSKEQTAPPPVPPQSASQLSPRKSSKPVLGQSRSRPLQRAKSNDGFKTSSGTANPYSLIGGAKSTGVDASTATLRKSAGYAPNKSVGIKTADVLASSLRLLENERAEYENTLSQKEKEITRLKEEIESLKKDRSDPDEASVIVDPGLNEELRSRIISQNRIIQQLKEHLLKFKKLETENLMLREEKQALEDEVVELRRKLNYIQSLGKPDHEVLLWERFSDLENKFLQRERKLQTLLNRLEVKLMSREGGEVNSSGNGSGSSNCRGSLVLIHQSNNNNNNHALLPGASPPLPIMPSLSPSSLLEI